LAGRHDDAIAGIARALDLCRVHHQGLFEPDALRIEAEILGQQIGQGDVMRSVEPYLRALLSAGKLQMRPLIAHCHAGLGRLCRRAGKREQAQESLATALAMYREMGMTYWLEKAEAEMRDLG
jgi:hypothetical protein